MTFKKLFPLMMLAILSACATKPPAPAILIEKGRWESSLKIRDLNRGALHSVSVDILAERKGPFRMEVSALLGFPVASFVMDEGVFRCAVYQQKNFYKGPVSKEALRPVMKIPLSPEIFRAITFDLPVTEKGWTCGRDVTGSVTECVSEADQIKINWKRIDGRKQVLVQGPGFNLDWFFQAPRMETQFKPGSFNLEAPNGFKVIQL